MILRKTKKLKNTLLALSSALALTACGGGGSGATGGMSLPVESPGIPSDVNDSLSTIDDLLEDLGL